MQHKFYIIYKTTDLLTGEYYIGQHRTNDLNDGYRGSGNWVKSKTCKNRELLTEILLYTTAENLCEDEKNFIGDKWMTDPYCMNECPGGGSGPHNEETKRQISNTRKQLGLKPDSDRYIKNTVYMHKDGIQKRVSLLEVNEYKSMGWIQGRLVKPPNHNGSVWITNGIDELRTDDYHDLLQSGWRLGRMAVSYNKVECPHCRVEGGTNVMKRWHFDRCKNKR